jgi:hypothetical protein
MILDQDPIADQIVQQKVIDLLQTKYDNNLTLNQNLVNLDNLAKGLKIQAASTILEKQVLYHNARGQIYAPSHTGDFKVNSRLDVNFATIDNLRNPFKPEDAANNNYVDLVARDLIISTDSAIAAAVELKVYTKLDDSKTQPLSAGVYMTNISFEVDMKNAQTGIYTIMANDNDTKVYSNGDIHAADGTVYTYVEILKKTSVTFMAIRDDANVITSLYPVGGATGVYYDKINVLTLPECKLIQTISQESRQSPYVQTAVRMCGARVNNDKIGQGHLFALQPTVQNDTLYDALVEFDQDILEIARYEPTTPVSPYLVLGVTSCENVVVAAIKIGNENTVNIVTFENSDTNSSWLQNIVQNSGINVSSNTITNICLLSPTLLVAITISDDTDVDSSIYISTRIAKDTAWDTWKLKTDSETNADILPYLQRQSIMTRVENDILLITTPKVREFPFGQIVLKIYREANVSLLQVITPISIGTELRVQTVPSLAGKYMTFLEYNRNTGEGIVRYFEKQTDNTYLQRHVTEPGVDLWAVQVTKCGEMMVLSILDMEVYTRANDGHLILSETLPMTTTQEPTVVTSSAPITWQLTETITRTIWSMYSYSSKRHSVIVSLAETDSN